LELPDDVFARITELCEEGNDLAEQGAFSEAVGMFQQAWDLLPEPAVQWEAATWILAALGDVYFLSGDYEAAREKLSLAMHAPGAIGNPFLHLRLGQVQFELGNEQRAADELARAYLQEGKKIFEGEDPKYLDFIKGKLRPPECGWPEGW
jgi:tetratricopeptide (TPR) repeat protein